MGDGAAGKKFQTIVSNGSPFNSEHDECIYIVSAQSLYEHLGTPARAKDA